MRRAGRRRTVVASVMVALALPASGCGWQGLNSLPLPGTQGTGSRSYRVYVQMPDVTTLTRNSPVMVDDVTVGTVSDIEVQGWHALVTVSLNPQVRLPENATAKIGQTSLLGSTHVELAAPADQPPHGQLRNGDTIGLDHAGVYPTTEQTLSALSVVLNGGGFSALGDITKELDAALSGRTDTARDLVTRLATLTTGLDAQRGDIVAALAGLDRVGRQFADQAPVLSAALDRIPPALQVLVGQRRNLTAALVSLGRLSDLASRIVSESGTNLEADLRQLAPVLKSLADTGDHLTDVLSLLLTFPFPMRTLDHALKGDWLNMDILFDLSAKRLDSNFLTGTPLQGIWGGVGAGHDSSAATEADDPLRSPLDIPARTPGKPEGAR